MCSSRSTRALTSWAASLAILMAAIAPAISHAFGAANASSWSDICSAVNGKSIQTDGNQGDTSPAPADGSRFEHCPYCSLHTNGTALPATPLTLPAPPAGGIDVPVAFFAAPRTLHAWLSAQPRAPPCFS